MVETMTPVTKATVENDSVYRSLMKANGTIALPYELIQICKRLMTQEEFGSGETTLVSVSNELLKITQRNQELPYYNQRFEMGLQEAVARNCHLEEFTKI